MACFHPLKAWQCADGSVIFAERRRDVVRTLELPCGQCVGCRLERSRQWAMRCVHEASLHKQNCFLTLTYNDANLPEDYSLNHRHFQLFMKRMRKHFSGKVVRYYMCGEYGERTLRPHYHACIFGVNFADALYFKRTSAGTLYTSRTLDGLWGLGHSLIGQVTFESAAYCARYIMTKRTGVGSEDYYRVVNKETGEVFDRVPEYNKMSLKPGIGFGWYVKYAQDVYPNDYVVVNGRKCKPPRYYDRMYGDLVVEGIEHPMDAIEFARQQKAALSGDNTPERLAVRKQVAEARLNLKSRGVV